MASMKRRAAAGVLPVTPGQAPLRPRVVGRVPAVTGDGLARDRVQAHGTDVVAERVPKPPDVLDARPGQVSNRRVAPEELAVFRDDAIYLRLLEHDLGDEHAVGMARAPPGKIAAVCSVPGEQAALEAAHQPRGRKLHGAQCSTRV